MSHTTVYFIDKKGHVIEHTDISDANLINMLVWRIIFDLYNDYFINDIERPEWIPKDHYMDFGDLQMCGDMIPFWHLHMNDAVLLDHRIVFASTFDRVIVMKEDFPRLIMAYEKFISQMSGEDFKEFFGDFNFDGLKEFVSVVKEFKEDTNCIGLSTCTSLISSFWNEYGEDGKYTPYNIFKSKNHSNLFDSFKIKKNVVVVK